VFFSERFLLPRPVLRALLSPTPALLLVDEVDKADPEFEAFLLEVLADAAVTIPELGTLRAKSPPRAVLTSNAARELSDALKRRCLRLHIDFPDRERELRIVRTRAPEVPAALAAQVVGAVERIRGIELKKPPSISETLDWARSLVLLNAESLSPQLVAATLNVLLKHAADVEKVRTQLAQIATP
jgi:MoxR-like ATPase